MAKVHLDFLGVKGRDVFELLRDTIRMRCKEKIDVEVLVDNPECVLKVQTFSKMTNCKVKSEPCPEGFRISIKGDACKCV